MSESNSEQVSMSGDIIALHEYRTLYFAVPKVANSTMKAVCADVIRRRLDAEAMRTVWNDRWKPSIFRSVEGRRMLAKRRILLSRKQLRDYREYWKFCLVRNPWDRLVSCWEQKIRQAETSGNSDNGVISTLRKCGLWKAGMDFGAFVAAVATIDDPRANGHFRSQYCFVTSASGKVVVDYIGRMEAIEEDLAHVFRARGIPSIEVPHLLRSKRRPYRDYYNRRTRNLVATRFARDISLFGYTYE